MMKMRILQSLKQSLHFSGLWITFVAVSPPPMISPLPNDLPSIAEAPEEMETAMQNTNHHFGTKLLLPIAIAVAAVLTVVLLMICICVLCHRRGRRKAPPVKDIESSGVAKEVPLGQNSGKISSINVTKKGVFNMFDYAALVSGTNNFAKENILGEGGFSCVYKACFSGGNFSAAVKKLDGTGPDFEREFESELDLLANIRHPNIISLLGYCINDEQRFLVYELMQNGTLETQLHGPSNGWALSWHIRMKIALDIARGLEYLHEHCVPPVIHRDLKCSNILLDTEFNAKISDFGLAVSGGSNNRGPMKLSGTIGYVAPEYLLDGKLTEKSDVYAFGVVLLELLLGKKPVEKIAPSQCQSIVTWAMPQLIDRTKLPNIVDPVIRNSMDPKHLFQIAAVAVLCVQPEPSYRPLITDVLHSLIPLVPVELGGTLRLVDTSSFSNQKESSH